MEDELVYNTTAPVNNVGKPNDLYAIPLKYRRMENLHIIFWLFKDVAWCMLWRPLGIAMIFPTLIIAIVISWRTRQLMSELCHNLAIVFWLIANSYWMVSEFFVFDGYPVYGTWSFKYLSLIPFFMGIGILAFYYLYWKPTHTDELETL